MIRFTLIGCMLFMTIAAASQEARQIAHRNIRTVTTRLETRQKGKLNLSYTTSYFDKKGRAIEVREFNADSICTKIERFTYNKKGRLIEQITVDSLAQSQERIVQHYDRRNLLTEKQVFVNDKLSERTLITYNTLDDRMSEEVYDESNKLKKSTSYSYDFRGMLLRKTTIDADGKITYDKINQYEY